MMDPLATRLRQVSLFDALLDRRSRRFGAGMEVPAGPFAYRSELPAQPLSEEEEAALVFAGVGITGPALLDLAYGRGQGDTMIAGRMSRTHPSGEALESCALVVTNDDATYLIKRSRDIPPAELGELVTLAREGRLVELYRRMRVKVRDGRSAGPLDPPFNIPVNQWSLYAPGSAYFLPINDMTRLLINAVMELLDDPIGAYFIDERHSFRPAGLRDFAKSRGGWLHDDPKVNRVVTINVVETSLAEFLSAEQGMLNQNILLMAQAIGLGAWLNFARHDAGWFESIGFRMGSMPAMQYLGAGPTMSFLARVFGRDLPVPYQLGLEVEGETLLKPLCPPYYPSMRAAVEAFVQEKYDAVHGWASLAVPTAWKDPSATVAAVTPPPDRVVEATIAYCAYIYQTYGRFPCYVAPYRIVTGVQATHVDRAFYDRFFLPEALAETQRQHQERWHAGEPTAAGPEASTDGLA
jgi:hypothetical protein